jgi:hypothetical protein
MAPDGRRSKAEFPQYVRHAGRGLCTACMRREHRAKQRERNGLEPTKGYRRSDDELKALTEEAEFLFGTDHPYNIAKRLGYKSFHGFTSMLRGQGRDDLADKMIGDANDGLAS